jgi:hypothetical protein
VTDPRIYEVTVALAQGDDRRPLTPEQARAVIDAFTDVRQQASKWRLTTQRSGQLLVIDPSLVAEIERFLNSDSNQTAPATGENR